MTFVLKGGDPSSPSSGDEILGTIKRYVPYPAFDVSKGHSEDEALNDFIFENAIPEEAELIELEDCAQAIVAQSMKIVTATVKSLDVSQLAPDLTLANLPATEQLTENDVRIDTSSRSGWRKGGFATVLFGYLGKEQVALKLFGDILLSESEAQLELKDDHFAETQVLSQLTAQHRPRHATPATQRGMKYQQLHLPLLNRAEMEANEEEDEVTTFAVPPLEARHYFRQLQNLVQEVSVMKQLKHKYIAEFRGVIFHPIPGLVMERAPLGNLASLITSRRAQIGPIDDLLSGLLFCDVAHDGILGRALTHRVAFQVRPYVCIHRHFINVLTFRLPLPLSIFTASQYATWTLSLRTCWFGQSQLELLSMSSWPTTVFLALLRQAGLTPCSVR